MCKREALKWHRLDNYNFPHPTLHPPQKTQKTLLLWENDWKTFQSTLEPERIFTCFLLFHNFQVSFFPSKIVCAIKLKKKKNNCLKCQMSCQELYMLVTWSHRVLGKLPVGRGAINLGTQEAWGLGSPARPARTSPLSLSLACPASETLAWGA